MIMKKSLCIIIALLYSLNGSLWAQNQADTQLKQAQASLANKDYIKARALFLNAYNAFASSEQYEKATECGICAAALYHRENYFKEAFDLLRGADQLIAVGEQKTHKARPDLRYAIVKERLQMYTKLKNSVRADEQLARLGEMAKASRNDSLLNDLLYTQANHYYTFDMNAKGDEAISRLIGQYKSYKQYDKVDECYHTLIDIARRSGNAGLTARTYEQYIVWTDSVRALKAQDELNALKQQCAGKQATIEEKESSLKGRQYIIIGLCLLATLLATLLVLGGIVLIRFILLTRQQKRTIALANEHNELKISFIRNISTQMSPTLEQLDASHPAVQALKEFITHIEELSELESHLSEPCEMQEKNIANFCESLVQEIELKKQEGVTLTVNAPKLSVPIQPDLLKHVLIHLLQNAAFYTPADGKITLDFKKRGAHTHQFIVSDTGCGIDAERRAGLFKPFTEVKDLTQGDGLGLPICALMATRMNGTLTLDEGYTKGARFVLELHA